jgi:CRISPR-associated exonuclease Cas4
MIVERIYNYKLQDYLQHKREENVIYVTDLVRCPLKLRFENQYKELALGDFFIPAGIMGDLVHSGLEDFLKEEFNAEVEVDGEKEVSIDGKTIKIKGRADAVIQKDGERVIVEIKSARADKGLPLDHHKMQLQVYLWMFEAKKGILVYVTPDRITEYEIDEPLDEAVVLKLVEEVIEASKAPRYSWECNYCQFNIICPNKRVVVQNA